MVGPSFWKGPAYAVAVVVEVQDLEWNSWLSALAGQELGAGSKGCVSELHSKLSQHVIHVM